MQKGRRCVDCYPSRNSPSTCANSRNSSAVAANQPAGVSTSSESCPSLSSSQPVVLLGPKSTTEARRVSSQLALGPTVGHQTRSSVSQPLPSSSQCASPVSKSYGINRAPCSAVDTLHSPLPTTTTDIDGAAAPSLVSLDTEAELAAPATAFAAVTALPDPEPDA